MKSFKKRSNKNIIEIYLIKEEIQKNQQKMVIAWKPNIRCMYDVIYFLDK